MNDNKLVSKALARAVASRKIPNAQVEIAANRLAECKYPIRGIDICVYGICLDYFIDDREWWNVLPDLVDVGGGRVGRIEVFPYGIIDPDLFHVRISHDIEEVRQLEGIQ